MDCLAMPVSLIRRRSTGSRMGYMALPKEEPDNPVTVVVGKNKRVFLVDPFILEENPFRVLIDISMKKEQFFHFTSSHRRVIFVDVDDILFEHMLWLLHNDSSSFFQLDLNDIIDFYTQDI